VTKTVIASGAVRLIISKVVSAYNNYGKKESVMGNSGRKSTVTESYRSSYTKMDCCEESQNYCNTSDSRTGFFFS
jgi:hypothetical protein